MPQNMLVVGATNLLFLSPVLVPLNSHGLVCASHHLGENLVGKDMPFANGPKCKLTTASSLQLKKQPYASMLGWGWGTKYKQTTVNVVI